MKLRYCSTKREVRDWCMIYLWRIIDDDRFGKVAPENGQFFDVVAGHQDAVFSEEAVPG